jgi:hypothetical protein
MRTYNDSYLYSNKIANNSNSQTRNDKAISDFIITSHRIDKNGNAFKGVIEDIKRQQTSSVLLNVLMSPAVVLCIGDTPLPRAFTVFDAKDPKNNKKNTVFIDVTGRIEYKDGYYVAKNNEVNKLCALLLDAMVYMLYRHSTNRLLSGNIVALGTVCYSSMFCYILDYLRIIGYSGNKSKIKYIVSLFFLKCHVGLDIDDPRTKEIAAKAAEISKESARAYDLLIDSEAMFDNIGTFVPALTQTFKLKGLDLPIFISRWMKSFGVGTEYATELFTDFAILVLNAYTGSYIVSQRQVETACGSDAMVKFSTAVIRIGADAFARSTYRENAGSFYDIHSKQTQELANDIKFRNHIDARTLYVKDFSSKQNAIDEATNIMDICRKARIDNKSKYAIKSISNGIFKAYTECTNILDVNLKEKPDSIYEEGSLLEVSKIFKNTISDRDKYILNCLIDRDVNHMRELVRESNTSKENSSKVSKTILELMEVKQYI